MSQLGTEKSALQHAEEEAKLLAPIRAHIGEIQAKIDVLRKDGSDQVQKLKNRIQLLKEDKHIKKEKKDALIAESNAALSAAQAVESKNQAEVAGLVAEAESYLKEHYEKDYFGPVSENCKKDRESAKLRYQARVAELGKEHEQEVQRLRKENAPDLQQELKDENYVYKNKLFDAKVTYEQELQTIKDRRHEAFAEQYHMIDLLRMSRFTFAQEQAQRIENYKYTFNQRQFLLKNGLYIVIVMIFIALSIVTPIVKNTQLFTYNNILNILQQASPRMFLALGVAGLILLTGTDLSIGRMTGMGMVAATIIMHKGVNTGAVFGKIFDFTSLPYAGRAIFALLVCIVLTTCFTSVAGFFTARFKMHPFISTMSNMLIIFGLVTYATKGVSFGAIEPGIASMIVPKVNGFPLIILWAVAAIVIVWFIWNKTRFGKNLYAVGGNPEAASVSGISVFAVTMGAFMMAGVLYGFGAWLECARMVGSGSAAYGQGWDMDAIAACVVGGVSFTGGIGKISGVVVGVLIFTALTYSLTILGIDTNLQFVFEGIIILTAVTLDCLKYVQKK
ncbi:ABC transporter permease subunit [Stomatobaculum longum]|uniref:ABC transporter permease subunit n=1 Tax=Stomatobaculum longum TaxID=796942 RepID=UPI0028EE7CA2|nr:galactoside ABC transporter permease [Stomatobaculum longum]